MSQSGFAKVLTVIAVLFGLMSLAASAAFGAQEPGAPLPGLALDPQPATPSTDR